MRAWLQLAQARPAEALDTLKALTEIDGFKPLHEYHAALINDVAGRNDAAERHYRAALAAENGPSVRLVEGAGNFLERRGQPDAARELYLRYGGQFPDSVMLTAALARLDAKGPPPPAVVATPTAGLAESLFNVAGALRQEAGGQLAWSTAGSRWRSSPTRPLACCWSPTSSTAAAAMPMPTRCSRASRAIRRCRGRRACASPRTCSRWARPMPRSPSCAR